MPSTPIPRTVYPQSESIRTPDPARPFVAMSNRKRWSKCALSAVLPQVRGPATPAAAEGTEAHKLAEWAINDAFDTLRDRLPPPDIAPPAGLQDFDYSDGGIAAWRATVRGYADTYAANTRALFGDLDGPVLALPECPVENVTIRGVRVYTVADVVAYHPSGRLIVGDYKFGRSPVGAGTPEQPNEQCAGALVLRVDATPHLPVRELGLFVYQPRVRHGVAWQVLAPLDLAWLNDQRVKLHAELAAVAAAARDPTSTKPSPGDHCTYCPSARWCPAAAEYGKTALSVEATRTNVVELTAAEVMALWGARPAFKAFEDDLRERVRMLADAHDPAVTTRRRAGNSMWANPAAAVEMLLLADRTDLLQPAGIEKLRAAGFPADDINAMITRAPDVLTYLPTAGKSSDVAAAAFAKYLPTKE